MPSQLTDIIDPAATPVQQRRIAKGLTRERLAAAAGLTTKTVYNVEQRATTPTLTTYRMLAEALGCEPSDLFDRQRAA